MKIISHRGNTDGPDPKNENSLKHIEKAIFLGFDVEIDLWFNETERSFLLGHDSGITKVDLSWILEKKDYLWVHCKNLECISELSKQKNSLNFFWHQKDFYTLTSKNYIWTYPGNSLREKSICVMPEWNKSWPKNVNDISCYGICSDFPSYLKNLYENS